MRLLFRDSEAKRGSFWSKRPMLWPPKSPTFKATAGWPAGWNIGSPIIQTKTNEMRQISQISIPTVCPSKLQPLLTNLTGYSPWPGPKLGSKPHFTNPTVLLTACLSPFENWNQRLRWWLSWSMEVHPSAKYVHLRLKGSFNEPSPHRPGPKNLVAGEI